MVKKKCNWLLENFIPVDHALYEEKKTIIKSRRSWNFLMFRFLSHYNVQLFYLCYHFFRFQARSKTQVTHKMLQESMSKILHNLLLEYCLLYSTRCTEQKLQKNPAKAKTLPWFTLNSHYPLLKQCLAHRHCENTN